jgi:hypothetical protein
LRPCHLSRAPIAQIAVLLTKSRPCGCLGPSGGKPWTSVNTTAFFDTHFSRLGVRDDLRNGLMTAA